MSPSSAAIASLMPRPNVQSQFAGFSPPTANYYRLPNGWFDIWRQARQTLAENDRPARIVAPLKITEYVIKHTWGWQNFADPIRLSRNDLRLGRMGKNGRLDRGTGLGSEATISRGIELAISLGLLEQVANNHDPARQERYYLPRLDPQAVDDIPVDTTDNPDFTGFAAPTQNYFVVPKAWSDLSAGIKSEVLILSVEYLFRHTWGWQLRDGEVRWLDADEVANGRRYRSPERRQERYDHGVGYSTRQVRAALADGVERSLLVWRHGPDGQRQYALRLAWMQDVRFDGYFDPEPDETEKVIGVVEKSVEPAEKTVGAAEKSVGPTEKVVEGTEKSVGRTCKDTDFKTPISKNPIKPPAANHRAAQPAVADLANQDNYTIYFRPELPNDELGEAELLTLTEAAEVVLTRTGVFYWSADDLAQPRNLDAGELFTPEEIVAQTALDDAIFDDDHALTLDADRYRRRPLLDLARQDIPVIYDVWQLLDLPHPSEIEPTVSRRRQRLDKLHQQHTAWGHPDLPTALEAIGISPADARQLIGRHNSGIVGGWLRAVRQGGDRLTNPAGLLITRLRAGEPPPGGPMTVVTTTNDPISNLPAHVTTLLNQLLAALHQVDDPHLAGLSSLLDDWVNNAIL
jgi:hypothetical protein